MEKSALGNGGRWPVEIWGIIAPTAGSAETLTVNTSATIASGDGFNFALMSFHNVDQDSPILDTFQPAVDSDIGTATYNFGTDTVNPMYIEPYSANNGGTTNGFPTGFNALVNISDSNSNSMIGYQSVSGETGTVDRVFTGGIYNPIVVGVALAAIPEPSSLALLAGALGLGAVMLRRRRA